MKTNVVQTEWPNGFKSGDAVLHNGRQGHVVSVPEGVIENGMVPVMYDDEGGCFVVVPADDLNRRF